MAGRVGSPHGLPVPSFRSANPALARPPFSSEGWIQSRNEGVRTMAVLTLACTRLHAPVSPRVALARYRHLRRIAGPVAAFRLTFGRRAVQ